MTSKLFLCLMLIMPVFSAYAIDDYMVSIQQVSKSRKTISVNTGFASKIVENDYGVLVKKESKSTKEALYKPVAKVRVIKVYSGSSIWIAYKTFMPEEIKAGNRLFLFSESAFLEGRRKQLDTKRTKLITKEGKPAEVKDFLLEGDNLAKKDDQYQVLAKPLKKEVHFDKEVDLVDIDKWEKQPDTEKYYMQGIYRSPYAKDFAKRKRVHTFEKMVVALLNKYNNPTFEYDEFYREQRRDGGSGDDFQSRSAFTNFMDSYEKRLANRQAKTEKFMQQLEDKGDAWSSDYSDEELSEVLNNISIAQERQRRKKLIAFKYNYQLAAAMHLNLLNNENTNDPRTSEHNKYDIDVAWEGYYFKKLQALEQFTLELSARRSQDGLYTGDANVKTTEYSGALHLNWYPYHLPNMVGVNIPYIGVLVRAGFATLYSTYLGEQGNYQVIGFPGFRGGIKYNFKNSYGIRFTGTFERIRFERLVRSDDAGVLPNRVYHLDGKLGIGITKFF